MFGSGEEKAKEHLINEGYQIKQFMKKNGDEYYFKVETTWKGVHKVKVFENWLGTLKIEKV